VFKDFYRGYQGLVYGTYNNQAAFDAAVKESVKGFEGNLTKLNGLLGDKQFIAGEITWIDFAIADFLQVLSLLCQDYLIPFPKLTEYQKRVWSLPELKSYFASDRFHERPINGARAMWR
jgi:glutathione S-transferase